MTVDHEMQMSDKMRLIVLLETLETKVSRNADLMKNC